MYHSYLLLMTSFASFYIFPSGSLITVVENISYQHCLFVLVVMGRVEPLERLIHGRATGNRQTVII